MILRTNFQSSLCVSVLVVGVLAACGDSGTGGAGGSGTGAAGTGAGGSGASGGGGGGTGGDGGTPVSGPALAVNELQPHDFEWVELANTTEEDVDLEGYGLCDEDASGDCEVAGAIRFPAGTTLPAGGFLLILTDQDPLEGIGPHTTCLGGVSECFYAPWKVSAADGETIRLIDPTDEVVDELTYPPDATPGATASWGRIPDGTGDPVVTIPTPGAANAE